MLLPYSRETTGSNKYKMPSILFTLASFLNKFLKSCTSFVASTFNPSTPYPLLFVLFFLFSLRFHSTPFCSLFFIWQLKEADTRLHNKDNNLQSILNELNTTVSLKVNQQALFTHCIPLIAGDKGE